MAYTVNERVFSAQHNVPTRVALLQAGKQAIRLCGAITALSPTLRVPAGTLHHSFGSDHDLTVAHLGTHNSQSRSLSDWAKLSITLPPSEEKKENSNSEARISNTNGIQIETRKKHTFPFLFLSLVQHMQRNRSLDLLLINT
jgi:hypothetical protein